MKTHTLVKVIKRTLQFAIIIAIGVLFGLGFSGYSKAYSKGMRPLPPMGSQIVPNLPSLMSADALHEGFIGVGMGPDAMVAEFVSPPYGKATAALIVNPDQNINTFHMKMFARTAARYGYAVYIMRNFMDMPYYATNLGKPFRLAEVLRFGAPALRGLPAELAARHSAGIPTFVLGHGWGAHGLVASRYRTNPRVVAGVILLGAVADFWNVPTFNTRTTFAFGMLDRRVRRRHINRASFGGFTGRAVGIPMVNHSCITTAVNTRMYMELTWLERATPLSPEQCSLQTIHTLELNGALFRIGDPVPPMTMRPITPMPQLIPPSMGLPTPYPHLGFGKGKGRY